MQIVYKIRKNNQRKFMMTDTTFGQRLREKREQAGLQANELAYRCGWNGAQRLSNYENGSRMPNLQYFSEICEQLDKINGDSTAHYVLRNENVIIEDYSEKDEGSVIEAFKQTMADAVHLDITNFRPKRGESDLLQIFINHLRSASKG